MIDSLKSSFLSPKEKSMPMGSKATGAGLLQSKTMDEEQFSRVNDGSDVTDGKDQRLR